MPTARATASSWEAWISRPGCARPGSGVSERRPIHYRWADRPRQEGTMRALTLLAVACTVAAPRLAAPHAQQVEFGAFGCYTRYDRALALPHQFGGGARLGYFFGNVVGAELDVGYQSPNPARLAVGGGSLVLIFCSSR